MGVPARSPKAWPGSTLLVVDTNSEIRELLTSRRARITPDHVGLATYGPHRVPALRRAEVPVLAGVSVSYHTRPLGSWAATVDGAEPARVTDQS